MEFVTKLPQDSDKIELLSYFTEGAEDVKNEGYISTVLYKYNVLANLTISHYNVGGKELNKNKLLWGK